MSENGTLTFFVQYANEATMCVTKVTSETVHVPLTASTFTKMCCRVGVNVELTASVHVVVR